MTSNDSPSYQVSVSANVAEAVKQLAKAAASTGRRVAFLASFQKIHQRLQNHPSKFGEIRFRLHALKMGYYIGAIAPVAVQFAVHEEKPIVFVSKVFLMGS
jgi:hypothetical protein